MRLIVVALACTLAACGSPSLPQMEIVGIDPSRGSRLETHAVDILGENFLAHVVRKLQGPDDFSIDTGFAATLTHATSGRAIDLGSTGIESSRLLHATIHAGIDVGDYHLAVTGPYRRIAEKENAWEAFEPQAGDWWDQGWTRRRKITIHNSAQDEDLHGFPVLVRLDAARIDYAETQEGGEDLRFLDADDITVLAHEIERWDAAGSSFVWVRVPTVDRASDTDHIWMYYGNQAATGRPRKAFAGGYAGVWHLNQVPDGNPEDMLDSSTQGKHGTSNFMGPEDRVSDAPIGTGLSFDGITQYIRIPSDADDVLAIQGRAITIEAWILRRQEPTGSFMTILARQLGDSWHDAYTLHMDGADPSRLRSLFDDDQIQLSPPDTIVPERWYYVAAVRDEDRVRHYVDAEMVTEEGLPSDITTDANDVTIGAEENGPGSDVSELWLGALDEVRVSTVARSADWIAAQFLSMTDDFLVFGAEEVYP